jgi:hypothetical protein
MTHTMSVTTSIPASRRLEVVFPPTVLSGEADIVVVVVPMSVSDNPLYDMDVVGGRVS